ncbi:MAG: hypothetical protein Tsb0034_13290 [Ekhidna sp.]
MEKEVKREPKFKRTLNYIRIFGFVKGLWLTYKLKFSKNTFSVRIPGVPHLVYLRPNTSDVNVLDQIFVYRDYAMNLDFEPAVIIDGGSYIGLSAVFFSITYPKAKVICIEPDIENFEMLEKNTKSYENITPIKAGLWNKETYLEVVKDKQRHYGFYVKEVSEATESSLKATTIERVISDFGVESIDILKLDIEGAEEKVFDGENSWLSTVKVLIIELHERLFPGSSENFHRSIERHNFSLREKGENLIYTRN